MPRRAPVAPAAVPRPRARSRVRRDLPFEGQVLLVVTLALTAFGQVMVYSASSATALTHRAYGNDPLYFLKNGILFTVVGVLAMLVAMRAPVGWLRATGPAILVVSIVLLLLVLTPAAPVINGARRWLVLGPLTVQPSELAKLGLLATLSALLAARRRPPTTMRDALLPYGAVTALVAGLVVLEPDLGSTLAIGLMVAALLTIAGTPVRVMAGVVGGAALLAALSIARTPYQRDRFLAFLDPWHAAGGAAADGYQVMQSMIAIGSGGFWGRGLGESVQKVNYLPEAHTDMIFAVIGEELGLLGTVLLVTGFGLFAWAGFSIALHARDRFSQLLAGGATALVVGQAGVNLGAVMGILPLTGIPLPLISYGSSSKVVTLVIVGVVLSVCREGRATVAVRPRSVPAPAASPQPAQARRRQPAARRVSSSSGRG